MNDIQYLATVDAVKSCFSAAYALSNLGLQISHRLDSDRTGTSWKTSDIALLKQYTNIIETDLKRLRGFINVEWELQAKAEKGDEEKEQDQ
ncbi:MAG: hypothetical protein IJJ20_03455 [Thermoguttaceae bacterium]|nr:hypothetical protein [Thermoguttaceae bacterium]